MDYTNKHILIISHNPLSWVNNNGKTLASIFEGVPKQNIYQIYLNADIPDYSRECHYLQINEQQIIGTVLRGKNRCCREVEATPDKVSSATIKPRRFANHIKRLVREGIWKLAFWKPKLDEWLSDKRFDVVFFMAGDGLFAYDVYRFVMNRVSAKGCLFFTDDYILGKSSRSPVALLRQGMLKCKIRQTMPAVDELYVISEEMKQAYARLYDMDGYVVRNFSVEKATPKTSSSPRDGLTMVYAGGLHYNRWQVLADIGHVLSEINRSSDTQCRLKIYSSQHIAEDIVRAMTASDAAEFCGGASAAQIAEIYADADILLHVESFDTKAIASTKYSFSTKIPEYLSAGKCVLAVGPAEVASVGYLADFACVITDNTALPSALSKLISDDEYRQAVRIACEERYEQDFSPRKQAECLARIMTVG